MFTTAPGAKGWSPGLFPSHLWQASKYESPRLYTVDYGSHTKSPYIIYVYVYTHMYIYICICIYIYMCVCVCFWGFNGWVGLQGLASGGPGAADMPEFKYPCVEALAVLGVV